MIIIIKWEFSCNKTKVFTTRSHMQNENLWITVIVWRLAENPTALALASLLRYPTVTPHQWYQSRKFTKIKWLIKHPVKACDVRCGNYCNIRDVQFYLMQKTFCIPSIHTHQHMYMHTQGDYTTIEYGNTEKASIKAGICQTLYHSHHSVYRWL